MPSFDTITVLDGESTPVSHEFKPRGKDAQGVTRYNESDGVPIGDNQLSVSLRNSAGKYRAKFVLAIPVTVDETINGVSVPKVTRTAYCNVEFNFSEASTTQERTNIVRMASNLLAGEATSDAVLIDLEDVY